MCSYPLMFLSNCHHKPDGTLHEYPLQMLLFIEPPEPLKDELPRSADTQYDTGEDWRNSSRKNEETKPKKKQHPV